MSNPFEAETQFINRKLPTLKVRWENLPALSQIISPPFSDSEASNLINKLRDALGKKAGILFTKMVFSAPSKLRGGTRVIVSIKLLREVFANEIDSDEGGGGKSYNPISTQPRPPGRGV